MDNSMEQKGQHTPGPWLFEILVGTDPTGDEWPTDVEVSSYAGKHIHGFDLGYRDDTDAEIIANARLIAAAPDLMDALEEAAHPLSGYLYGPALDRARAAIAKAKGTTE